MLALLTACGLESPIVNAITQDDSRRLPDVKDTVIQGVVVGGRSKISAASGGHVLEGLTAESDEKGVFALHLPGTDSFQGMVLSASGAFGQYLDLVPYVPRQGSVFNDEVTLQLPRLNPPYPQLDVNSTAATLLVLARAILDGKTLNLISVDALGQAMADLRNLAATDKDVGEFYGVVSSILKLNAKTDPFNLDLPDSPEVGDLLSRDFTGSLDDGQDLCKEFVNAVQVAAGAFHFKTCYSQSRIVVVFMVDMTGNAKDRNCQVVDPFKWAKDKPGKTVYFTGGLHKTTPICGPDRAKGCLTNEQARELKAGLGNWTPNQIPMYDDGTHGDVKAGDTVYTITFELPYIPLDSSPDHRGVRIGYKYTYGFAGQAWTDSEEWPGNQRILELEDVNGDGLVIRYNVFGDETSNKDKANALTPANGGCGVNLWETDKRDGCGHDTWENQVDTDGDCQPDTWPRAGNVSPITVPCKK